MEAELALVAAEAGDLDAALDHFNTALAIREKHLPPDHPDTATTLANLAGAYARLEDLDRAYTHASRALLMRERSLGPDHAEVGESHQILGAIALFRAQWEDAVAHLEAALRIRRAAVGSDHGSLVMELQQLASAQTRLRRLSEARTNWKEALRIGNASGANPATLGSIECSLAGLDVLEDKHASAVGRAEEGLRKILAADGSDLDRGICRFALARALDDGEHAHAHALELANEALADFRKTPNLAAILVAEVEAWLAGK
jgi:hypothetical protein